MNAFPAFTAYDSLHVCLLLIILLPIIFVLLNLVNLQW